MIDPHELAERRSLAYHRAVATRIAQGEALVRDARERVVHWRDEGKMAGAHAAAWLVLLDGPRDVLLSFLVDEGERARELRQSTPFAGALSPRERWALWADVKREVGA